MMRCLPLTKSLLRERADELVVYLRFLKIALERDAAIVAKKGQIMRPLDKTLTHMLKANVSLLLYSAMEAYTVQMLDEIHKEIEQNCSGTDQLNAHVVLLIANHFRSKSLKLDSNVNISPLQNFLFKNWVDDWQDRSKEKKGRKDCLAALMEWLFLKD
ncbi:hypothetical protein [Orrella marina]|uniref:Uncharacterized protein n=1 Tax=Orrella marina TaxID=2163011 RepID=A0A2R4XNZ4_9BURK|nr:hypothetical protein [Orrella marina]AWB35530.1 hypothetical protein DBV39_19265 [Orrella marina]